MGDRACARHHRAMPATPAPGCPVRGGGRRRVHHPGPAVRRRRAPPALPEPDHRAGRVPGPRGTGRRPAPAEEHHRVPRRAELVTDDGPARRARDPAIRARHPGRCGTGHPEAAAHSGLVRDRDDRPHHPHVPVAAAVPLSLRRVPGPVPGHDHRPADIPAGGRRAGQHHQPGGEAAGGMGRPWPGRGGARGAGRRAGPLREQSAQGHWAHPGHDRADHPAGRVCADRPGIGHARRRPVRLECARLPADDRQPRHRPGVLQWPETPDRGRARAKGGRLLERGVQPRPVRDPHLHQPPPGRVDTAAPGLPERPFRPGVPIPTQAPPIRAKRTERTLSNLRTTTAAGGSQGGAAAPRSGDRADWLSPVNLAIALTTLVALVLRGYLLLRPGLLTVTQYDDGPYFGSAVRLVHGVLPYRDYAFVQPPGITVLMSPVALLTYLTGTAWGLGLARILTVLAGAAAVTLAGLLVRHRGTLAVLLAGGVLALYAPAAGASRTVLLEPWLVLFCLIGAVTVFDGDRVTASTRRLVWGGVLFGFAGAIKAWAIVPVLVVAGLCVRNLRRTAMFVAGVAAGFLVTTLPFAAASPRLFYDDVLVAQLARIGERAPVWHRLQSMIGIPGAGEWTNSTLLTACIALVAFVILAQVAAWLVTRQPMPPLDWFATLSAAVIVAIFLWPAYFASHYSAFLGPFLAIALALPVSRLVAGVQPEARARRQAGPEAGAAPESPPGRTRKWLALSGLILIGAAIIAGAVA